MTDKEAELQAQCGEKGLDKPHHWGGKVRWLQAQCGEKGLDKTQHWGGRVRWLQSQCGEKELHCFECRFFHFCSLESCSK